MDEHKKRQVGEVPTCLFFMMLSMEYLDQEITGSPIVSDDYLLKGFASLSYLL